MNARRAALLLAPLGAAAIGAGLAFERERAAALPEFRLPEARAAPASASAEPIALDLVDPPPLADFVEAFERPLFEPERRFEDPEAEPTGAAEPAEAVAPARMEAELHGVLHSGDALIAILTLPGHRMPVYVTEGDVVAGWRAEAVEPDRIRFRMGDRTLTLELVFGGSQGRGR